jgi:hypothetical protein
LAARQRVSVRSKAFQQKARRFAGPFFARSSQDISVKPDHATRSGSMRHSRFAFQRKRIRADDTLLIGVMVHDAEYAA